MQIDKAFDRAIKQSATGFVGIDQRPLHSFFASLDGANNAKRIADQIATVTGQWDDLLKPIEELERRAAQCVDPVMLACDVQELGKRAMFDVCKRVTNMPLGCIRCGDEWRITPILYLSPLQQGGYELVSKK